MPPLACVVMTPKAEVLYVGKLAVASAERNKGLARLLLDQAEVRARALGLSWIELQTRIELEANHRTFAAMGFIETERTAHPGYNRPTSITFRRAVSRVGVRPDHRDARRLTWKLHRPKQRSTADQHGTCENLAADPAVEVSRMSLRMSARTGGKRCRAPRLLLRPEQVEGVFQHRNAWRRFGRPRRPGSSELASEIVRSR